MPFIPVIAGALKNREILLPGFAAAILGYAVGNYLGIIVANITRMLVSA
ncbi:MAG: putative membrane protein [Oleispira sp.]